MSPVESEEDLTRKQRREQARTERKALEEAEATAALRRTRLTQLGAVAAVVIVAIVVILIATGGGSKSGVVAPHSKGAEKTSSEVTKLIGGIPQSGNTLGASSAPVTLQYFGDLECPICKEFSDGALQTLITKWVRPGKLRIQYRSLETATREPETFKTQQIAALAAGKQQKMWHFLELFYKEQGEEDSGYVTESYLQGLAKQVPGLNLSKWSSDRNDTALSDEITADAQAANTSGFTGTPSFLIGRSGGAMKKLEYTSLTDPGSFNNAIEQLIKS